MFGNSPGCKQHATELEAWTRIDYIAVKPAQSPPVMFVHTDRKSYYKAPPTVVTDRLISQEARRAKVSPLFSSWISPDRGVHQALEEQKRVCVIALDRIGTALPNTVFQ